MNVERVQHTPASGGDEGCREEKWDTVTPSLTSSPTGQHGAREVQQGVCCVFIPQHVFISLTIALLSFCTILKIALYIVS